MRIITKKRLLEASAEFLQIRAKIYFWHHVVKNAKWTNFARTRATFRHADQVKVKSGRTVTIFNLKSFRVITAIHYDREIIYILRVLTHAEYDEGTWKETL